MKTHADAPTILDHLNRARPAAGTFVGVIGLVFAFAAAGGCMRMQTQQTTLEHKPKVIAPEQSDAVANAPTSGGVEEGR